MAEIPPWTDIGLAGSKDDNSFLEWPNPLFADQMLYLDHHTSGMRQPDHHHSPEADIAGKSGWEKSIPHKGKNIGDMWGPISLRLDPYFPILYHFLLDSSLGMILWWDADLYETTVFHIFLGANCMVYHHMVQTINIFTKYITIE